MILCVAIFCMATAIDKMGPPTAGVNDIKDISGHRSQRAIVSVILKLLSSAKFSNRYGRGGSAYLKGGGYRQALHDFDELNPSKVKELVYPLGGFEGQVGDRMVTIYKKSVFKQKPTIVIWRTDGRSPDLIRYDD